MDEAVVAPVEQQPVSQTPAPPTEPTGWMSPTGEFRNGAPEQIQQLLDKKQWKTVEDLVTGYDNLEKFNGGGDHLSIPEEGDTEAWSALYNKIGRPAEADAYELSYEGDMQISDELTGDFKKFAHVLGLNQKQFNEIVGFQLDAISAQIGANSDANIASLKQTFGEDKYETKLSESLAIAEKHGLSEGLEAEGIGSSPTVIRLLNMVANMDAEDTLTPSNPLISEQTPSEELKSLMESDAFSDKFDRNHGDVMKRFMELNQFIANSGQGRSPRT
jgi:hypothetical protein